MHPFSKLYRISKFSKSTSTDGEYLIPIQQHNSLFDGVEPDYYGAKLEVQIADKTFEFYFKDFINNPLDQLKELLPEINIDPKVIAKACQLEFKYDYYRTSHGEGVYFFLIDNYLLIVSFGEWQNGRYITALEGIWKL